MPVNLPNFLQAETRSYGPENLLESAIQGYQMSRIPKQTAQEEQRRELANILLGHKNVHAQDVNKFYPQIQEQKLKKGDIDLSTAQLELAAKPEDIRLRQLAANLGAQNAQKKLDWTDTLNASLIGQRATKAELDRKKLELEEKKLKYPGLTSRLPEANARSLANLAKDTGNLEDAAYYDNLANELSDSRRQKLESAASINKLRGFNGLPTDNKKSVLATAAGGGISETEFLQGLEDGKNLIEQLKAKGYKEEDIQYIEPNYAPTGKTISQQQQSQSLIKELNAIEKHVTEGLAPYARRDFSGYSLLQISDAIRNDNPDRQAKFLAAVAMQPEIASIRLRALNAPVGQRMIKSMTEKSQSELKTLGQTITPEVYRMMQNYMNEWINEAAKVARQSQLVYKEKPVDEDEWELVSPGGA